MASIKVDLCPWSVPNFVRLRTPARPRQEGIKPDSEGLPLSVVPVEALVQLCEEFRAEVFRKAGKPDPAKLPGAPTT